MIADTSKPAGIRPRSVTWYGLRVTNGRQHRRLREKTPNSYLVTRNSEGGFAACRLANLERD